VLPDILVYAKTDHLNQIGLHLPSTVICMDFLFTLFDSALMAMLEMTHQRETRS